MEQHGAYSQKVSRFQLIYIYSIVSPAIANETRIYSDYYHRLLLVLIYQHLPGDFVSGDLPSD